MNKKAWAVVLIPAAGVVGFWLMVLARLSPSIDGLTILAAVTALLGAYFVIRYQSLGTHVFRRVATPRFWADAGERSFQLLYLVVGIEFVIAAAAILLLSRR